MPKVARKYERKIISKEVLLQPYNHILDAILGVEKDFNIEQLNDSKYREMGLTYISVRFKGINTSLIKEVYERLLRLSNIYYYEILTNNIKHIHYRRMEEIREYLNGNNDGYIEKYYGDTDENI